MEPINFRRLTEGDLGLMHQWLNTPHVMRWYSPGGRTPGQVAGKYMPYILGEEPTEPYLILCGGTPVGYIQTYRINEWPDYAQYIGVDDAAAGLDLFIGEPAYTGRGLGPIIISGFLREFVFGLFGAASCVIGPDEENRSAVRAYEKVGFRYWKRVLIPGESMPEYLMRVTPADMLPGGAAGDNGRPAGQRAAGRHDRPTAG